PAIQSITYLFCSSEEPSRVSERVYQDYGITNGLKEMNPVMWGPDYRLDGRTILTLGYGGHACPEGRGYELKLQDFQLRTSNMRREAPNQPRYVQRRQAEPLPLTCEDATYRCLSRE